MTIPLIVRLGSATVSLFIVTFSVGFVNWNLVGEGGIFYVEKTYIKHVFLHIDVGLQLKTIMNLNLSFSFTYSS